MKVLAIETSCDETACAVVDDGIGILSNVVSSQVEFHSPFGGIVPEIASRKHVEWIIPVVREALRRADITLHEVDRIAVTRGPGLVGSLMVGMGVAKSLAYSLGIPLVGVHHLMGHVAAIFLEHPHVRPPFVALVVSGGHTALFSVDEGFRFSFMGGTRDDAAGEAFDKVAKLLGLGYPGGERIDRLARKGDPGRIMLPRPLLSSSSFDFSFSGLKTWVLHYLKDRSLPPLEGRALWDLIAGFQEAVVDILVVKSMRAVKKVRVERLVVTGGVAANSRLREVMASRGAEEGVDVLFPSPALCTDNAAMIARAAIESKGAKEDTIDLTMDVLSRWPI